MKTAIISPCHIQPSREWISALPNDIDIYIVDDSNGIIRIDGKPNVQTFDYAKQKNLLSDTHLPEMRVNTICISKRESDMHIEDIVPEEQENVA